MEKTGDNLSNDVVIPILRHPKMSLKNKHSIGKHLLRKYNFSEDKCTNKPSLNKARKKCLTIYIAISSNYFSKV